MENPPNRKLAVLSAAQSKTAYPILQHLFMITTNRASNRRRSADEGLLLALDDLKIFVFSFYGLWFYL